MNSGRIDPIGIILLLAEPRPLWQGLLLMLLFLFGLFVLMAIGGYFAIKALASTWNSHRDSWEVVGTTLGLSVDASKGGLRKPFSGIHDDRPVSVEHFAIPTGRYSADHYAEIHVDLVPPLDMNLEITERELLHQKAVDLFDSTRETGNELFDNAFRVRCSDIPLLVRMLNLELPNGQNITLLNDLSLAAKKYRRVTVTDAVVSLGAKIDDGPEIARQALEKAAYLASRIEEAATKVGADGLA